MTKFTTARQAAELINDGDLVAVNGMGYLANPGKFFLALEDRYLETKKPCNIGLYATGGLGGRKEWKLASRLSHPGLINLMIVGHLDTYRHFFDAINNNTIEAYNLPQGVLSINLHMAAAKRPGYFSRIGLKTFIDPRQDGGALNAISKRKFMELSIINGKEYIFYKTIYPDVCVIRGTTADTHGNITFENEASILDPLAMAQAVKNNHGKVIVQVERISASPANPHHVRIPGQLVDAIYVDNNQMQTATEKYNPLYCGELKTPEFHLAALMDDLTYRNYNFEVRRSLADRIIARRASLELRDGDMINLGVGIPMLIGLEAYNLGILNDTKTFTIEGGTMGGFPVGEYAFGATINADAIYTQAEQFEFYEGNGLSITFVGALEIDQYGNVNVAKIKGKLFGCGGFNHVTQTPRRVVICTKFCRDSEYRYENDQLVLSKGSDCKFCDKVESITLSSEFALEENQEITYITERAVFKLTEDGLELIEIAPGLDMERDILSLLPFRPIINNVNQIPSICYEIK